MNLKAWIHELEIEIAKLSKIDFGYPHSINKIDPPDLIGLELLHQSVNIPAQLETFYRECGGVKLNDIWNGYLIYSPQSILKSIEIGEPIKVVGSINSDVVPFGSDIGGHRIVIKSGSTNEVLYLPHGDLVNGIYEETTRVKIISPDFFGFLERLLGDTKAYVRGDEKWSYMDKNLYDQ
ncbi:MAG: SMI1/KNR4 family protein [Chloroflexi bacterium]|nr:SMI1/KNR4 family protein [Chloroflexota bacterium]MCC6893718.1 hypothetical protein [Anaerolineae bacterium]